MTITVPDKRNAPLLGAHLDPMGSPPPHRLPSPSAPIPTKKQALGGTIKNLNSRCQLTGGYEMVPGEIRGSLLKISYVAYTKKRASRCGA